MGKNKDQKNTDHPTPREPMKQARLRVARPKALGVLGIIVGILIVAFLGVLIWQESIYAKKFHPNTSIADLDVGELTLEETREFLDEEVEKYLSSSVIELVSENQSWKLIPSDIEVSFDSTKTVKSVSQKSQGAFAKLFYQFRVLFGKTDKAKIRFSLNQDALDNFVYRVDQEVSTPYKNPTVAVGEDIGDVSALDGYVLDRYKLEKEIKRYFANLKSEALKLPMKFICPKVKAADAKKTRELVENIAQAPVRLVEKRTDSNYILKAHTLLEWLSFKEYLFFESQTKPKIVELAEVTDHEDTEKEQVALRLSEIIGIPGLKYGLKIEIDKEQLGSFFKKLEADLNEEPTNATLVFEDNQIKIIKADISGWAVDIDTLKADLEEALNSSYYRVVVIRMEEIKAQVRMDNLDELGIKRMISTGVSSFAGSPRNRIFNIKLGASRFNGALIKPGEEFSFNKHLGKVDASTGYLPELVIKENKTVPEYGGGLCQVSTTMFRTALNAGLGITARRSHAYPVRYYKWPFRHHGTDATVYPGSSDLKFTNDTENWILIQARVIGSKLYFDFFGDLDPEREVELTTSEYDYGYRGSGSLRATLIYEVFVNGELIRRQKFQSNYKSPNDFPHPGDEEEEEKDPPDEDPPPDDPPDEDPPPDDPPDE